MFDEPSDIPPEQATDAKGRAQEKADALRMHAELAAVFEATRKFEAQIEPTFDADTAREVQRAIAKLERDRTPDTPLLTGEAGERAAALLSLADKNSISTNDYHIYRRPGEVMVARWLAGEQVDAFYVRLQAHFDAAMNGVIEDERQNNQWKDDAESTSYLTALEAVKVNMTERYLREIVKDHRVFALSTQTADEINIAYLCDTIMGASAEDLVGPASAPPADPTEADLAWFFKLFSLRGVVANQERMLFFAFLQKTDESASW